MSEKNTDLEGSIITRDDVETREPPMYKALLHNDDYTTMDFVITVLRSVFNKTADEATQIMLNVHEQGIGVAGIYTYEICETKIAVVHEMARRHEYPLRCSMEPV